jgi:DGQHR domain-containing protein
MNTPLSLKAREPTTIKEPRMTNTVDQGDYKTFSVSLVTQGKHRFYTLTMPSEVLAATCTVDTRAENPVEGFQRKLDSRRAEEIARYIDEGMGTIPTSIVLSAQEQAELKYDRTKRSITFKVTPRSFLILDGQHRVFGFSKASTKLRVPVVIYNSLSRADECRLFIDINTKQRPVPNELLLDIKRLAETETDDEALLRAVFDKFTEDPSSPLAGLMSPSTRGKGKISRVTFNTAIRSVWSTFAASDPQEAYDILAAYLEAWRQRLKALSCADQIVNPTLFKTLILLFPDVAQRVADRHGKDFSVQRFAEALEPFKMLPPKYFRNPGQSHLALYETFQKRLRQQFTIAGA